MDLEGKQITIVGLGETARALAAYLKGQGARPFVTEARALPSGDPRVASLRELDVPYELGGHTPKAFQHADYVTPSPGVPASIAPIQAALQQGARLLTELDAAWSSCRSIVLAITGTNGKTTATELLRSIIAVCGHTVHLAGNNAVPFSRAVMEEPPPEFMVLEVSSYALEHAQLFHPRAAAVLNLTPDHLARHGSMEAYAAAKARIFRNQTPADIAVLNYDNEWTRAMAKGLMPEPMWFSLERKPPRGLHVLDDDICEDGHPVAKQRITPLRGRHNMANVLAALTMARAAGFDWGNTLRAVETFRGVEHRLEVVPNDAGLTIFNDSKATNLDSMRMALESFDERLVLIAGGEGKGSDYAEASELIARRVKHLVLMGADAPAMEAAWGGIVPTELADAMDDAVERGLNAAGEGGTLLLSPACASFDMYQNFEERGRAFKDAVARLATAAREST